MAKINFYIEYRNTQKVMLPVNPEEFVVKLPGKNSTENILTSGDINILKLPGLKATELKSFIPVSGGGSYIETGAPTYAPQFYIDFFTAIRNQKESIKLIVTGINFSMTMGIEDFEFSYTGSDEDMHYTLSLREWKSYAAKVIQIAAPKPTTPAPATPAPARENTPKVAAVGSTVRVNGQLHRDSYGGGPGVTEKNATRKVSIIAKGRAYPYHVTTLEGGWRGWVAASAVEVIS